MKEMIARVGDRINKDGIDSVCLTGEELIRCKDCKYAHLTYDGDCKYCDNITDDDGFPIECYHPGDWFCADGERREGR